MASNLLRKVDLHLLRNYPNLWALRLPHLLVGMAVLSLLALVVARLTPVALDDMPKVGETYIVWLLLAALPFVYWVMLFMRIHHPMQQEGVFARALSIIGVLFACMASWVPASIYITVIEARMSAVVEPLKEEIVMYDCVAGMDEKAFKYIQTSPLSRSARMQDSDWVCYKLAEEHAFWHTLSKCVGYDSPVGARGAPSAWDGADDLVDDFEAHCVSSDKEHSISIDERARLLDGLWYDTYYDRQHFLWYRSSEFRSWMIGELDGMSLTSIWGNPSRGSPRPHDYSKAVAVSMAKDGLESSYFWYHESGYMMLQLFIIGYLTYFLFIAWQAPRTTFVIALVSVTGLFALSWALSTLDERLIRIAPVVHLCVFILGTVSILGPGNDRKHIFLVELWLCMIPLTEVSLLMAVSEGLPSSEDLILHAARGCWAALAVSPLIHIIAERFRSRPK